MRVLHINGNYIYSALHRNMIRGLDKTGVSNFVFVPAYEGAPVQVEPDENARVSECFKRTDRLFFDHKQKKIVEALETADPGSFDLIHAYTTFTDGNSAMRISERYGIPYIVAVRSTDANEFFRFIIHLRSRGREILRKAAAVLFLSASYRDKVIERYILPEDREDLLAKSVIIPNGIDDFWFENRVAEISAEKAERVRNREIRLIFAGGIDRNKNPGLTAEAAGILNSEGWNVTLTAVGKVKDRGLLSELEKNSFFRYEPARPKEELIDLYRDSDIFVMPSHSETFGLVYPEAMSQGLPVIYTRGEGFDGQFREGEAGYPVSDRDPAELAETIKKTAANYEKLAGGAINIVNRFRWEEICGRYAELYERLLAQ